MAKSGKRGNAQANIALESSKQKRFNQKIHRIKQNVEDGHAESGSAVVYVSHLPWGFEEQPLREYFQQFGKIKQLRVSRSKKTGNSRGFAYIQFTHSEVAKIVAETMNNYLMFGKLIKCKHLQKPHPNTFKNAHRGFIKPASVDKAISRHNSKKSDAAVEKSQKKMLGKLTKLHAKLAAQGIQYTLEDSHLDEIKKELKTKAEEKKKTLEKKNKKDQKKKEKGQVKKPTAQIKLDDDSDDDEDDDDGDDSDDSDDNERDETEATKTLGKNTRKDVGQKTPKTHADKSFRSEQAEKRSAKKGSQRQALIPTEVDTPKGKMNVLIEDSSEDEISFKTPPHSIKSTKLDDTLKSMKGTPASVEKTSPKRKFKDKTPKSKEAFTPEPDVPAKKVKLTPKSVQDTTTPKTGQKKKDMSTPKSANKNTGRPQSGRKTPGKSLPSETKRKQLKK